MKKLDEEVIDIQGESSRFKDLVKDCKLLTICATRMRSIAVGCSGAIIMHLAKTLEVIIDFDSKTKIWLFEINLLGKCLRYPI